MTISGNIHKLSGTDDLNDFRFACKSLASCLRSDRRIPQDKRYFMRRVTEEVCDGSPTLRDVTKWLPRAQALMRGGTNE